MKKLIFILVLSAVLWNSSELHAQMLSDLSSAFKQEKASYDKDDRPISSYDLIPSSMMAEEDGKGRLFDPLREKAGLAFLSSALIPGSGQAANGKWGRAGVYFAAEVIGIIWHLDANARARRQERAYEDFTNQNWSVVAYSQWLVNYSAVHDLNNGYQTLAAQVSNLTPNFTDSRSDWRRVDINVLRNVERLTPYIYANGRGSNFSHLLPNYGSQQYYELISKYYQYQPGWRDWYNQVTIGSDQSIGNYIYMWNGQDQPFGLFYQGRDRAQQFNDNYRTAGNILKLLVVNHVVSAFDAYFTVRVRNTRLETQTNLMNPTRSVSLILHF